MEGVATGILAGVAAKRRAFQPSALPAPPEAPTGATSQRVLRMAQAGGADVARVRVRHYTRKSALKLIEQSNKLLPKDQNSVFTVPATRKPGSPRDVEKALGIDPGKGNAYVDFDAMNGEYTEVYNPTTQAREFVFKGTVDLTNRNPSFKVNR
jgi:hypothetical protein